MQPTTSRRALLLVVLFLAFGTSLIAARAYLLLPRITPTIPSPTPCPRSSSYPTNLIIIYPTVTPASPDTLSLNLPGPILVVPPPCP